MAKNKLTIKVDVDTQEALKQMKELTEAANECVAAFEKLEKAMDRFEKKPVQMVNFNPVIKTLTSANEIGKTICRGTQI
ncbi:hypothetical protein [Bacillus cereus]|uniref:hypothetical protein n=1 Tax=Bacillus cereus TaxID=1396 RepID=UPI000BF55728|nr:hypothetical protein [Bacillus cereus]PFI75164.1 hypothetical protein COI83_30310 [Bacillus cereus]